MREKRLSVGGMLLSVAVLPGLASTGPQASTPEAQAAGKVRGSETYGRLPLSFEANQGQTDPQVKFLARGSGYTVFLTPTEAVLTLRAGGSSQRRGGRPPLGIPEPPLASPPSAGVEGPDVLAAVLGEPPAQELFPDEAAVPANPIQAVDAWLDALGIGEPSD
jgi:hypothetical protein